MTRPRPVVTIDGPAGAGKSTVSRTLADRLGRRFPATVGQAIVVVGLVPLAAWPAAPPWVVLVLLAVAGVGGGLAGAAQQAAAV